MNEYDKENDPYLAEWLEAERAKAAESLEQQAEELLERLSFNEIEKLSFDEAEKPQSEKLESGEPQSEKATAKLMREATVVDAERLLLLEQVVDAVTEAGGEAGAGEDDEIRVWVRGMHLVEAQLSAHVGKLYFEGEGFASVAGEEEKEEEKDKNKKERKEKKKEEAEFMGWKVGAVVRITLAAVPQDSIHQRADGVWVFREEDIVRESWQRFADVAQIISILANQSS